MEFFCETHLIKAKSLHLDYMLIVLFKIHCGGVQCDPKSAIVKPVLNNERDQTNVTVLIQHRNDHFIAHRFKTMKPQPILVNRINIILVERPLFNIYIETQVCVTAA